ncbi:ABC transporter ATP-binding protein [Leifsonia sp. A12D58]|uniref:ABC transporter ATP-binding protein n=1 Tax=Leifsonia sp. A12D58 TaxID=3397674 RepID=UPI0039E1A8F7
MTARVVENVTATGHGVEISHLVKKFGRPGQEMLALDDVNLTVAAGEFVSVIGPSGCGKSTLLKVVAGLLEADGGSVTIGTDSVREATKRKLIGLVPQAPALLPWRSVRDNVRLPLQINPNANAGRALRDPDELLTSFGLGHALEKFPKQLSGGMQQRVAIARAFAFDPALLLMDEPFSALDEINRDQQRLGLLDFWQTHRKSVMFVTHSVPEAIVLSDRIVLMAARPGRIAEIIDVNLPRPRTEDAYASDAFRELEGYVRSRLSEVMQEVSND